MTTENGTTGLSANYNTQYGNPLSHSGNEQNLPPPPSYAMVTTQQPIYQPSAPPYIAGFPSPPMQPGQPGMVAPCWNAQSDPSIAHTRGGVLVTRVVTPRVAPATNEWKYKLLRCCDGSKETAITTAICPPLTEYKLYKMTSNEGSAILALVSAVLLVAGVVGIVLGTTTLSDNFAMRIVWQVSMGVVVFNVFTRITSVNKLRVVVRQYFAIKGDWKDDLLAASVCHLCGLCQLKNELDYQKGAGSVQDKFVISVSQRTRATGF